jgi:hypothetical protein
MRPCFLAIISFGSTATATTILVHRFLVSAANSMPLVAKVFVVWLFFFHVSLELEILFDEHLRK